MTAVCLAGSGTTISSCAGGSGLRGRRLHTTAASPLRQLPCSRPVPAGSSRSCVRVLAFRWGSGNNSDNKASEAAGGASTQPPQPPAAAESQPSESDSIRDIDAVLGKAPKLAGFADVAEGADDPPGGGSGSEAERAEEVRVRRQEAFREVLRPPASGYREPTDELMAQARAEADAQQQQQQALTALNALGDSGGGGGGGGGGGAHRLLAALEGDPRTRGVGRAAGRSVQGLQRWWAGVPDKRLVVAEAAALAVAAYLGSAVLGAVERAPLLPQAFQAVGLAYSSWFWWRFVLFARGRQELRQLLGRAQAAVAESVSDLAEAADSAAAAAAGKDDAATAAVTARAEAQRREAEADSTQAYVEGLLQELDERQARLHTHDQGGEEEEEKQEGEEGAAAPPTTTPWAASSSAEEQRRRGGGGGGSGRGGPPAVFALRLLSAAAAGGGDGATVFMARQRGPEEVESMNGIPDPSASASASAASSASSSDPPQQQSPASDPPPQMALDPCLGWDTEACAATGHMQLEAPDMAKLEALAEEAARQARVATGFSRHVDQALHAPGRSRGASMEEEDLEGQYGRAAGALERQEMEQMAKQPHAAMPHPRSQRQPAQGEETGTGPQR